MENEEINVPECKVCGDYLNVGDDGLCNFCRHMIEEEQNEIKKTYESLHNLFG